MAVILTFDVPATACELGAVSQAGSDESPTIELETLVPTRSESVPFFWIHAADVDPIVDQLRDRSTVIAVDVVERTGRATLVALDWDDSSDAIFGAIRDANGHILRAVCRRDRWEFVVRFSHHQHLSTFRRAVEAGPFDFHVQRIYHGSEPGEEPQYGLTASQQEALSLAVERGYYDIPRRCTTAELAEQLDISSQAVTERLRRGIANLTRHTLLAASSVDD
ncbi:helix-turn-helix domain-containing protein [Natronorubrum sp. JWXQ-INN-674]|uniref:Helix-turn-helix domain-containing protein n=1 Tax=Natronorubrum halalkaliphilum TaxID=2691917 RepID=A0A6B0VQ55_9EURY|nr:helix-turn-helix domain-containing protein [Natronorubrum halalkaliphilum]MXV63217.1 helix-turn-helix domain-containing protein [Natronorubrum halalkaliphilum]